MRWALKEALPIIVIIIIVSILTLVPYFNNRAQLSRVHSNEVYACKLSAILREFASTAADARFITAQKGSPELKKINLHAAQVYTHVRNELRHLPDIDCKKVLGIKGN